MVGFQAITGGSLSMPLCIPRSIPPFPHTLDMPLLIIIFITLFACFLCLSAPAWYAFMGAIHMHVGGAVPLLPDY